MDLRNVSQDKERKLTPIEVAAHNLTRLHCAIVAKQKFMEDTMTTFKKADCELSNLVNEYAKQQAAFQQASTDAFNPGTKSLLSRHTNTQASGKVGI